MVLVVNAVQLPMDELESWSDTAQHTAPMSCYILGGVLLSLLPHVLPLLHHQRSLTPESVRHGPYLTTVIFQKYVHYW